MSGAVGHVTAAREESGTAWERSQVYPGKADQVGKVRSFLHEVIDGCPLADEVVLLASELAANAVMHSNSGRPGGFFTVRAAMNEGCFVRAAIEDQGGPWHLALAAQRDGRWHGLDLVNELASDWGRCGAQDSGWVVWFRVDWPARPVDGGPCE